MHRAVSAIEGLPQSGPHVVPTLQKTEMKRSHLFVMSQPRWVQNGEAGPPRGPSGPQVYFHPEAAICTQPAERGGTSQKVLGLEQEVAGFASERVPLQNLVT